MGWIFSTAGFIIGLLRFQHDFKPQWLDLKVFVFYYSFFETKYFSFIYHNITDEIAGILLLCGLVFLCFSREKIETDTIQRIRLQSLMLSLYVNSVFLILSFLFIYGIGFLHILVINLFSPFFFYFLIFSIVLRKQKNENTQTDISDSASSQ